MNKKDTKWFTDARFGMFIHWGLYAIPGGIWKGQEMEYIGEWLQSYFRIPNQEYAKLAKDFNPTLFDADEWIRIAKDAGVKYIVFTTKHHDGFAMYHSKVDSYNIVDSTPFHRDPLKELADACHKYGVKLGIYYSHYLDWHEEHAGDLGPHAPKNAGVMSWGNDWDFPDWNKKDFKIYLEKKLIPQLTELFTNYGEISVIWFDCGSHIEKQYGQQLVDLIQHLQPQCLINSRIGNGLGDYGSLEDNQRPNSASEFPLESPVTLNRTWGFKWHDEHWKTAESAAQEMVAAASKNTNYLLNIGPRPDGALPQGTLDFFRDLTKWMKTDGNKLFGATPNPFPQDFPFGWCLARDNRLIFYVKDWQPTLRISGIKNKILEATVPWTQKGSVLTLSLPERPDSCLPSIEVTLDGAPDIMTTLMPQNDILDLPASKGTLHHGKHELIINAEETLGLAAERRIQSGHSLLDSSGMLSQWHNPEDSIEWTILLPEAGTYEIYVDTERSFSLGTPWFGGRTVEVTFNGETLENELAETEFIGDYHKCAALSKIGEFKAEAETQGTLTLRTTAILDNQALDMELASVRIVKISH